MRDRDNGGRRDGRYRCGWPQAAGNGEAPAKECPACQALIHAAYAVRYGMSPDDALRSVTINPARQFKLDDRIGSLAKGKDADFVVWSGSPLSTYSIVEQTWIDGRRYFDRAEDLELRRLVVAERDTLLKKARAKKELDEAPEATEDETGEEPAEPEPAAPERAVDAKGGRS